MAPTEINKATVGELIKSLQVGEFVTIKKIDQGGALQARRLKSGGVQFYWRYTSDGVSDRVPIGTYDPIAPPKSKEPTARGYSIAAAVAACEEKAKLQQDKADTGGYREHVAAERRAQEKAKADKALSDKHTLAKLLEAYVEYLKKKGRRSFADAVSLFRLHVLEPWPALAATRAANVTTEQMTDVLRAVAEAGKGRTSNKLRSYLRAAFQCAVDVNVDHSLPISFKVFKITVNPVAPTKRIAAHDKADKNPLSLQELRTYWQLIQKETGIKGGTLRLHLLSGGQRIEQLVKLENRNVRRDQFTIFDAKGRPALQPRPHTLPLIPAAADAAKLLANDSIYVLSTDGGETPLAAATLSNWSKEVVADDIADFQLKRVRSGIETALAAAGISKEIRGYLQSHGMTGVQAKHYDGYDYFNEKLEALETLFALLEDDEASRATKPVKRKKGRPRVDARGQT